MTGGPVPGGGATLRRVTHWIGGKARDGMSAERGQIFDPSTGEVGGFVDMGTQVEVDEAVAAALRAFPEWRDASLGRRAGVLFSFRELLHRAKADLAAVVSSEHGKVISDATGEVERGIEVVDFACGIPHLLKGSFSENVSTGIDAYSVLQPLGVVAGITPFNFPAMVPMWMFPVALACGNTFVLKPSEKDPSASVMMAELLAEAGLPDGVFNVVQGSKAAVERILVHPDVAAVSFVGSTPVARMVYKSATAAGKRVQALGGAKNHMVVLPDADLDVAARAAVSAAYGSAGERCMAISALVAVGGTGDALLGEIGPKVAALRLGAPLDPASEMGPLVTAEHRARVASYLDAGVSEGATLAIDGRRHPVQAERREGFWLGPSLLDHVTPKMSVYTDEIFGPVLSMVRMDDLSSAIGAINSSTYGNGAAIFTSSGGAARRFQREVQVGMVGVNVPIPVPMAYYSFGGWKQSLFGDSHVHGMEGVHFYTRTKAVTSRWASDERTHNSLSFPTTT
ncbi:MAG: CoA-acylating methylmalonate-semialdehyde dehydrogenase [Acidimicrobiales bacterium]